MKVILSINEFPICCGVCRFSTLETPPRCVAVEERRDTDITARPSWCPLVEVLPEDLKDLEEISKINLVKEYGSLDLIDYNELNRLADRLIGRYKEIKEECNKRGNDKHLIQIEDEITGAIMMKNVIKTVKERG